MIFSRKPRRSSDLVTCKLLTFSTSRGVIMSVNYGCFARMRVLLVCLVYCNNNDITFLTCFLVLYAFKYFEGKIK